MKILLISYIKGINVLDHISGMNIWLHYIWLVLNNLSVYVL